MKIIDIQKLKSTVSDALAGLKLTKASDLDTVAHERAVLREKLELLSEAESAEAERIKIEKQASHTKRRTALLTTMDSKLKAVAKAHAAATVEASKLMQDLARVLVHRDGIFTRESCGLAGDELYDLLTTDERHELFNALDRTAPEIRVGNFGQSWKDACTEACGDDKRLFSTLSALVNTSRSDFKQTSLASSTGELAAAVANLPKTLPIEVNFSAPDNVTLVDNDPHRIEVDLRK